MKRASRKRDVEFADNVSPDSESGVTDLRGRMARFVQLALALDDLLAASACLKLMSKPDPSQPPQFWRALFDAMAVAYGRLFLRSHDEACGLPDRYEPTGPLRATHLQLLGIRNLMRQHRESSSRRVMVGPAHSRGAESHVAPGGRIVWSVRADPLGPLDLQQVDALLNDLRARVEGDAGQLCSDLFAGRATPAQDVVLVDASQ